MSERTRGGKAAAAARSGAVAASRPRLPQRVHPALSRARRPRLGGLQKEQPTDLLKASPCSSGRCPIAAAQSTSTIADPRVSFCRPRRLSLAKPLGEGEEGARYVRRCKVCRSGRSDRPHAVQAAQDPNVRGQAWTAGREKPAGLPGNRLRPFSRSPRAASGHGPRGTRRRASTASGGARGGRGRRPAVPDEEIGAAIKKGTESGGF